MKSIILTKYGAPEVLKVKELKDLEPSNNQARIKVHYAGINFAEIMARMKLYPGGPKPGRPPPGWPGFCWAARTEAKIKTRDAPKAMNLVPMMPYCFLDRGIVMT